MLIQGTEQSVSCSITLCGKTILVWGKSAKNLVAFVNMRYRGSKLAKTLTKIKVLFFIRLELENTVVFNFRRLLRRKF